MCHEAIDRFKKKMESRRLMIRRDQEKILGCGSKTRKYAVKIEYKLLEHSMEEEEWLHQLCWNKHVLPKAGAFT